MALQTKTFTAGGTAATRNYSIKLKLTEESTSVSSNVSLVSYEFSISRQNYGIYTGPYYNWDISIGGKTIAIRNFAFNIPTSGASSQVIVSGQIAVGHNADGSMVMPFNVYTPSAQDLSPTYGPPEIRLTGEWALTTIPRASTVVMSAASVNIEDVIVIGIYSNSSTFTHKLVYTCGTIIDEVLYDNLPGNTQNYAWTIPTKIYQQIPNAKSIQCTVTCYTYSGGVEIGTSQTSCMLVASEDRCRPGIVAAAATADSVSSVLTGNNTTVIRYVSAVSATVVPTPKNSASIVRCQINGIDVGTTPNQNNSYQFERCETNVFTFIITDSRGYVTSHTVTLGMVNYIPLTCNPTVKRVSETGSAATLTVTGNFWSGDFGVAANSLSISYQIEGEPTWIEMTPSISGGVYSATASINSVGYEESATIYVKANDATGAVVQNQAYLPRGIPVFDWGKEDFNLNVLLKLKGVPWLELVYPVGSIYMSMADTDPGSLFGGVWERIRSRFLLGAGAGEANNSNVYGSYGGEIPFPAGELGGTPWCKLTVNDLPPHSHGFKADYKFGGKTFTVPTNEGDGGTGITPESASWGDPPTTPAHWAEGVWGTTDTGGGAAHTNMPPFLAVYMWKRVA